MIFLMSINIFQENPSVHDTVCLVFINISPYLVHRPLLFKEQMSLSTGKNHYPVDKMDWLEYILSAG